MTSIFRYSKNYGSLTHETGIKYAVNMEDLICLLATVRTLKVFAKAVFLNLPSIAINIHHIGKNSSMVVVGFLFILAVCPFERDHSGLHIVGRYD